MRDKKYTSKNKSCSTITRTTKNLFFIIVDFLIFDCKKVKTLKLKSSNQYEKL